MFIKTPRLRHACTRPLTAQVSQHLRSEQWPRMSLLLAMAAQTALCFESFEEVFVCLP